MTLDYDWQEQQTALWEQWWRKRRAALLWRPSDTSEEWSGAWLRGLLNKMGQNAFHLESKVSGTVFDNDLRFLEKTSKSGRLVGPIVDGWWFQHDFQVHMKKWTLVQEQIKASWQGGSGLHDTVLDVLEALLRFEMHCLPVYLYSTLQVIDTFRDEWPMLAGLACAQLPTGTHSPERTRKDLTNALIWQSGLAAPSDAQIRRVLRQESLKSLWVLPFLTLSEAHSLMQKRLDEIQVAEPERFSSVQIARLSRPLDLPRASRQKLTLDYSAETANALKDLPNSISNSIIAQSERTKRNGQRWVRREADFLTEQEEDDCGSPLASAGYASDPLEAVIARSEAERYKSAMNDQEYEAILLFSQGNSYAEIAAGIQAPLETVRKRIFRARKKSHEEAEIEEAEK